MCVCVLHVHGCVVICSSYMVQTCSRVLLDGPEREHFVEVLKKKGLSMLARRAQSKKVIERCKKVSKCPHCQAVNGRQVYS